MSTRRERVRAALTEVVREAEVYRGFFVDEEHVDSVIAAFDDEEITATIAEETIAHLRALSVTS